MPTSTLKQTLTMKLPKACRRKMTETHTQFHIQSHASPHLKSTHTFTAWRFSSSWENASTHPWNVRYLAILLIMTSITEGACSPPKLCCKGVPRDISVIIKLFISRPVVTKWLLKNPRFNDHLSSSMGVRGYILYYQPLIPSNGDLLNTAFRPISKAPIFSEGNTVFWKTSNSFEPFLCHNFWRILIEFKIIQHTFLYLPKIW